ncbi:hypothetical protein [Sediminibacterium soli]|uniref:hypothetical protein n=1 Tax=Sediminibacterium soli TaxID=2698829 RepID=UPI0013799A40|nr:hypothetical protein [Sediminibacterium soli]NCI45992.1 hypothetical protein [Sediminibacterium soli]
MRIWTILALFLSVRAAGQELYVFSEPASNMPSRSLGVKQTAKWLRSDMSARTESRHTTELMLGVNKKLMWHVAGTFSDMYSSSLRFESVRTYAKYRFLSSDDMYRHFRMAAFAEASYSRNKAMYDELSLEGDQSGIQAGIIATQLLHKLALSSTISFTELLQESRWNKTLPQVAPYQAFNYSLSAGYLVLPKKYTSYNQMNLNLYLELLGQQTTDKKRYFVDLAPAAQLIFNSEAKLNVGYRFQLGSDMHRMSPNSWLLSLEWQFLNVLK